MWETCKVLLGLLHCQMRMLSGHHSPGLPPTTVPQQGFTNCLQTLIMDAQVKLDLYVNTLVFTSPTSSCLTPPQDHVRLERVAAPEQVAERYWLRDGHCETVVLKLLLLGSVHALQGLHAPLEHVPLLSQAVYLQAVPIVADV